MKQFAHVLSVLLHPLLMPVYTLWLALQVDPRLGYFMPADIRPLVLGMMAVMTVGFPLASALLLVRAGLVDDLHMRDRRQRMAPYIMTLLYFVMAYYLLRQSPAYHGLLPLFSGALIALLGTLLITPYWKISAHMVGIGGLLGALAALVVVHDLHILPALAGLIVLAGALGTARLNSSDHTHAQVYAGALLGFACTHTTTLTGWAF